MGLFSAPQRLLRTQGLRLPTRLSSLAAALRRDARIVAALLVGALAVLVWLATSMRVS